MQRICIQIGEVIPILYLQCKVAPVCQYRLDILIVFLHLDKMRMRFANGIHQSVATEIAETGYPFGTIIASIAPIPFTVFIYLAERLVYPIPNTAALYNRFRLKYIHIFFQSATAVTHCMQILGHYKGTVNFRFGLACIRSEYVHTAIHTAVNVRIVILLRAFILYRTRLLYRLHPIISTFEVDTVSGFITQ